LKSEDCIEILELITSLELNELAAHQLLLDEAVGVQYGERGHG